MVSLTGRHDGGSEGASDGKIHRICLFIASEVFLVGENGCGFLISHRDNLLFFHEKTTSSFQADRCLKVLVIRQMTIFVDYEFVMCSGTGLLCH